MATGLWIKTGVPHKGWTCIGVDDLRGDDPDADLATCEMCQVQQIRFVHQMTHPDYQTGLQVGCVCAEKMEDDYVGPRRREAPLRSRATRRAKWLKKGWKRSQRGYDYAYIDGFRVTIFPVTRAGKSGWGGLIVEVKTNEETRSRKVHPTSDAAKLAAFKGVEVLKVRN
jgi:hypothetical protein